MNRRIGMPPTAAGLQNRGPYKPPVPAAQAQSNQNPNQGLKRPPLSDVSNLQAQMDGSSEVKKAKVAEQTAELQGENAAVAVEGP
jgi:hypothetical protein